MTCTLLADALFPLPLLSSWGRSHGYLYLGFTRLQSIEVRRYRRSVVAPAGTASLVVLDSARVAQHELAKESDTCMYTMPMYCCRFALHHQTKLNHCSEQRSNCLSVRCWAGRADIIYGRSSGTVLSPLVHSAKLLKAHAPL